MKSVLVNAGLVTVAMFMFALPFVGFGFIEYKPNTSYQPEVLGVAKSFKDKAEMVEQIEYDVSLGDTTVQRLYNVLDKKYLSGDYQVVLSIPNDAVEAGVKADLVRDADTADVIITTPFDFNNKDLAEIRLIIIVLE